MSTGPLPQLIGRYRIVEKIGAGGMATVYRAYDPVHRRDVAIKVLSARLKDEEIAHKRFEREASTLLQFKHPHILPVYDVGTDNDTPYIVMRLLSGQSLATLLKDAPLPLDMVARLTRQIAGAIDYAHAHGVIHRDIKPKNILLDADGTPYLADFGIALAQSGTRITTSGNFVGTAAYASPEQCRGEAVKPTTDVYSLAVLVFEMITGRHLFEAASPLAIMKKHMSEPPPNPLAYNPSLPVECYVVLSKALAKLPESRYPTALKFSEALDEAFGLITEPTAANSGAWLFGFAPAESVPAARVEQPPDELFDALPAPEPDEPFPFDDEDQAPAAPSAPPRFGWVLEEKEEPARRPTIQPLPRRAARRAFAWEQAAIYASMVISLIALVAAALIAYHELAGSRLNRQYRSDELGIEVRYPSGWTVGQTSTPLLASPGGGMLVLSDQSVLAGGPYHPARLVIAVLRVDPALVFGVPRRCMGEIAGGPEATFGCMAGANLIVPIYQPFTSDHFAGGVKLPGSYPPTTAARPMVLFGTGGGDWLAVIVVHWDGYPDAAALLDDIAASVRPAGEGT